MWFRDKEGNLHCIMRKDFHTDTEYYEYIAKVIG
jgi:hypothetical protein